MACRAVDEVGVGYIFTVVCGNRLTTHDFYGRLGPLTDEDSPEVNEDEESNICELLQWKNEWEDVVWYTLRKTVHGVEGVASVRRGHNPFMVRLVQRLINHGMMQSSVDPVDAQIREKNEQRELKIVVESKRSV